MGRMLEPAAVVEALAAALAEGPRPLAGRHVLVTAGPTVEDLDPVRFLTNRSSGKMGFAIAAEAARLGARVTLVAGPVALATPAGVTRVDVRSAGEMQRAVDDVLGEALQGADALVMAAAVADYRPAQRLATKIKKAGDTLAIDLVRNPDILAEVGGRRRGAMPVLVGFALETGDDASVEAYARGKLASKRCDVIVANEASTALEGDASRIRLVAREGDVIGPLAGSKRELAAHVVAAIVARLTQENP
jgi:phosphopantothenoylcysteine decarboxylase/phosphopantothenate--cysteine ligase